jgi:hypothetical protein
VFGLNVGSAMNTCACVRVERGQCDEHVCELRYERVLMCTADAWPLDVLFNVCVCLCLCVCVCVCVLPAVSLHVGR